MVDLHTPQVKGLYQILQVKTFCTVGAVVEIFLETTQISKLTWAVLPVLILTVVVDQVSTA
jgi:flagellar biosynthesis protein FliQ